MSYSFQSINFNADDKLIYLINKRTNKLKLFFNKIISIQVFAKVENNSTKINKHIELILNIPGEQFIVKKTSFSFEGALSKVSSSVERRLKNHKQKLRIKSA
ncbi:MAG: RNA polymerase subunit sigma-54 [Flavobacteriaceae bacterium]|nr:RNA polymerase subunit sigma-54 [Flavobacteriaceae bacterium]|tara:strand:+ start:2619 stop:2924 length:306 start_codon:yes stop_codon:yes gene_type:complete